MARGRAVPPILRTLHSPTEGRGPRRARREGLSARPGRGRSRLRGNPAGGASSGFPVRCVPLGAFQGRPSGPRRRCARTSDLRVRPHCPVR